MQGFVTLKKDQACHCHWYWLDRCLTGSNKIVFELILHQMHDRYRLQKCLGRPPSIHATDDASRSSSDNAKYLI